MKLKYYCGPTVSVDALYSPHIKETKNFWLKFGTLAQDMEAGTVLTLARVKGVRAGVILLVVDREAEKDVKEKIAQYSVEAKKGRGPLVKLESQAAQAALEAFLKL